MYLHNMRIDIILDKNICSTTKDILADKSHKWNQKYIFDLIIDVNPHLNSEVDQTLVRFWTVWMQETKEKKWTKESWGQKSRTCESEESWI